MPLFTPFGATLSIPNTFRATNDTNDIESIVKILLKGCSSGYSLNLFSFWFSECALTFQTTSSSHAWHPIGQIIKVITQHDTRQCSAMCVTLPAMRICDFLILWPLCPCSWGPGRGKESPAKARNQRSFRRVAAGLAACDHSCDERWAPPQLVWWRSHTAATRALIQYKDVILPVQEIPLWRFVRSTYLNHGGSHSGKMDIESALRQIFTVVTETGFRLNIKTAVSHKDKTAVKPSYLCIGNPYTGKTDFLHFILRSPVTNYVY